MQKLKTFFLILTLLLSVGSTSLDASADRDSMFDACINILNQSQDVIKIRQWSRAELPANVEKVVAPTLVEARVIRWISHKNNDASITFLVLTRSDDLQTMDDYDLFDIISQKGNVTSLAEIISTSAMAFTKETHLGVAGVLSCTDEALSNGISEWDGHVWD